MLIPVSFLVASFLLPDPMAADLVELKSGERVEGTFKQATPTGVVIEVAGQTITFPLDRVRAIYFGAAPVMAGKELTPPQPSPLLMSALNALKALSSMTEMGVTYRDYWSKVQETKIEVDRFLQDPAQSDLPARKNIEEVLGFHVLAAQIWNAKMAPGLGFVALAERIQNSPIFDQCPLLLKEFEANPDKRPNMKGAVIAAHTEETCANLWKCANAKLAEADRVSVQKSK